MAKINWEDKNVNEIKNLVRGLNPIMGAYSFIDNKKVKFWKVEKLELPLDKQTLKNGTVIISDSKQGLQIKAKDGIINVIEIQGENARKMGIGDYLRGNNIEVGKVFE